MVYQIYIRVMFRSTWRNEGSIQNQSQKSITKINLNHITLITSDANCLMRLKTDQILGRAMVIYDEMVHPCGEICCHFMSLFRVKNTRLSPYHRSIPQPGVALFSFTRTIGAAVSGSKLFGSFAHILCNIPAHLEWWYSMGMAPSCWPHKWLV